MSSGAVLITYADSFGGDISSLGSLLSSRFAGCFSGIHLLPFFPSSGDRGFSPVEYGNVDPVLGSWEDIRRLGEEYEITADFMVNHISARSVYYQDWLKNGDASPWADLFLPLEKIFPGGNPDHDEAALIYRRQERDPWLTVRFDSGETRRIWCTFSEEQIDIDILSPPGLRLFRETLERFSSMGIRMVRLDAVGYITKKRGTSCFMVEPEIWLILEKLKETAAEFGIRLLPEMHEHYRLQLAMAGKGFPVYDFALPMLVLYACYSGIFTPLRHWLEICPRRQYTTLDTHDGIGVVDAADLLTPEQSEYTVDKLYSMGSNVKRKYSSSEYGNLDIYQINCTFYSALGENDDIYIMARAIQCFVPGIPQIYYVGLLAGSNDLDLVESTRQGRDINRHNYTREEVETESSRSVVERLKNLLRFRRECSAFDGEFGLPAAGDSLLIIQWTTEGETVRLEADLETSSCFIERENHRTREIWRFIP